MIGSVRGVYSSVGGCYIIVRAGGEAKREEQRTHNETMAGYGCKKRSLTCFCPCYHALTVRNSASMCVTLVCFHTRILDLLVSMRLPKVRPLFNSDETQESSRFQETKSEEKGVVWNSTCCERKRWTRVLYV